MKRKADLLSAAIAKTLISILQKFGVLKAYINKYNLLGGIVRQDKQSSELCICTDTYSDNIKSDSWKLLSDVL